ncbi:hypothetical protein [Marinobacter sp. P4B1]|uniref:hypothetical protein n=1 Tax=Marinobacter sp. P4B1 TaxID=1119533 RepID=UPI00071DC3B5|nr:hypothetical protein [Marinobacter sp. P4B1]KRW83719.1 hypothetical protein AQ621_16855 [Marinobacter sp. P4B1]
METLQAIREAQLSARQDQTAYTLFVEGGAPKRKPVANLSHAAMGIDFSLSSEQALIGFVFPSGRFEGRY